jgi:uncharacterized protein YciI
MNYFLVLLSNTTDVTSADAEADNHERFIDSLIASNAVVLGGPFENPVNGFSAGYVLAAEETDKATALAHEDPLVAHGIATCPVAEWRLVGINAAAIDPRQVLTS